MHVFIFTHTHTHTHHIYLHIYMQTCAENVMCTQQRAIFTFIHGTNTLTLAQLRYAEASLCVLHTYTLACLCRYEETLQCAYAYTRMIMHMYTLACLCRYEEILQCAHAYTRMPVQICRGLAVCRSRRQTTAL